MLMLSLDRQNELREQYRQINPAWQPATEVYADWVRRWLEPGSWVLDLGCGRGGLIEQLDQPLQQYIGIDPDWSSLAEHRLMNRQPPPGLVCAISHRLPFKTETIDLIFASWLLEHLPKPEEDMAEINRVLKPGGVFVFVTPNKRHPFTTFNRAIGRLGFLQGRMVERLYARPSDDTFPTYYRANTQHDIAKLVQGKPLIWADFQTVSDPTYYAFNDALFRLACRFMDLLPQDRHIHLVGALRKQAT